MKKIINKLKLGLRVIIALVVFCSLAAYSANFIPGFFKIDINLGQKQEVLIISYYVNPLSKETIIGFDVDGDNQVDGLATIDAAQKITVFETKAVVAKTVPVNNSGLNYRVAELIKN